MALYVYAVTLFVSAFILFLVQPLIGKMVLPKLGGTPQVWNTCCVFFQMMLLAGYAYTHIISSRLKLRQQLILHSVMLILPLGVLFLLPTNFFNLYLSVDNGGWNPGNPGANPIPATLYILFVVIGLPFLVVSTTAPLLQKWFAYTGHPAARDPYFLYGASNLGSLLALVAYPVALEPALNLDSQTWVWAGGFFVLIGAVLVCVGMVWGPAARAELAGHHGHADTPPAPEIPPQPQADASTAVAAGAPQTSKPTGIKPLGRKGARATPGVPTRAEVEPAAVLRSRDEIDIWRRLRWIALAAIPSSMMLGITTHITTDLSPIPLFWVIPLALYLLTFILVFARWPLVWTEQAHPFVLYIQPACIALMLFADMWNLASSSVWASIVFHMVGFFATTLVCHGELAKDRPSTRYLTEFYLWMSVGGMLGGMFNALFAPMIPVGRLWELSVAIFAACLLRPKMKETGWTDELISGLLEPAPEAPAAGPRGKGQRPQQSIAKSGATPQMVLSLDFILPACVMLLTLALAFVVDGVVASFAAMFQTRGGEEAVGMQRFLTFGVPLVIACLYFGRPLRFGLAVGAIMLVHFLYVTRGDASEFNDRSFFGIISVKRVDERQAERQVGIPVGYRQLIHGHINHGMNFIKPSSKEEWGDPKKDFSRLATTYYHRLGPAGRVMELFNWFKDPRENVYPADARMPASIVGNLMGDLASGPIPTSSFANLWSEPPFATIGLGTGTMASYGRPYQHVHYYEIDNHIRRLSLPNPRKINYTFEDEAEVSRFRYFTYLNEAILRGCEVQVLMGDARLRMAMPYKNFHTSVNDEVPGGGPEGFYHMMVVDAFSSDAIPAHLITKEAIKMYFKRLSEEGVLCVHTSNRFVSLPRVVAAVTAALNEELTAEEKERKINYACVRGHDVSPYEPQKVGHFTSEWVMVARKAEYLKRVREMEPADYEEANRKNAAKKNARFEPYWNTPVPNSRYLWTDNYYTLWTVLRRAGDTD